MARRARHSDYVGSENFGWARLVPHNDEGLLYEYRDTFSAFLVQVVSESDEGHDLHDDPLNVLSHVGPIREAFQLPPPGALDHPNYPEEDKDPDNCSEERNALRATVTRLNAERPANRVHRAELWVAFSNSPPVLGAMQYKYCEKQPPLR